MKFISGLVAFALVGTTLAYSDDITWGKGGADAIFVHPIAGPAVEETFRAQVTVTPAIVDTDWAKIEIAPLEATGAVAIGSGQMALQRAKATAIRMAFSYVMPVDVLSVYRNLDQGIDLGLDVLALRVPIKLTEGGEIVVMPGMEMGVRHFNGPVDKTTFHTSFNVEARAAKAFLDNWLSTGIMAKLRYDLDSGGMSGFEESAMGYVSLLLDRDHRVYARLYAGIDHQAVRAKVDQPTVNFFTGFGIFGNFSK